MNHRLSLIAGLFLGTATLYPLPTRAATFNFNIENLTGDLSGESLSGSFQFDDSGLTGTDDEFLPVSNLTFDLSGNIFTEADAVAGPEVIFSDSQFLGLNYAAEKFDSTDFSFISFAPGSDSIDDSQFIYSTLSNGDGTGDISYSQVSEPGTFLGSTAVLGLMVFLRRRKK